MLQFLTHRSNNYSIAEEAQMAIEGGCTWIQVTKSLNPDADMRQTLLDVQPLCEENQAFLIVDSDVELANELRIHGVHLHKGDIEPAVAREKLGPHAVIGVDSETAADILALKGLDIDYVVLGPFSKEFLLDDYRLIIAEVRAKEFEIPIVARGEISVEDIKPLLDAGVNGVALSLAIIDAADPVEKTRKILAGLTEPIEIV